MADAQRDTDPRGRLDAELKRWGGEGRTATFWWRDDDAEATSPELDHLRRCAVAAGAPLGLAVIPAKAASALAEALADWPLVRVLQHGFNHQNNGASKGEWIELGGDLKAEAAISLLKDGWRRIQNLGPLPVVVPPWNNLDPAILPRLAEAGFRGLSVSQPRQERRAFDVVMVNTHVDIMNWDKRAKNTGNERVVQFKGEDAVLKKVVDHLTHRRLGIVDTDEPTGLLTHHLVHDDKAWRFLEWFPSFITRHPAARWCDPLDLFGLRR